jgi:hypothetical protein
MGSDATWVAPDTELLDDEVGYELSVWTRDGDPLSTPGDGQLERGGLADDFF